MDIMDVIVQWTYLDNMDIIGQYGHNWTIWTFMDNIDQIGQNVQN